MIQRWQDFHATELSDKNSIVRSPTIAKWMQEEINELRAELEKLKQQEPVGNLTMDGEFIQNQRYVMEFGKVPRCQPLYLAAGAKP